MNRIDASSVYVTSFLGAFQCLRKEERHGCSTSTSGETADRPAVFGKPTATVASSSGLEPPDPDFEHIEHLLRKELEILLRNGGFRINSLTTAASSGQVFLKRWRRPSASSPTSTTRTFSDRNVGLESSLSSSLYGLCPASACLEALEELWTVWRRSAATASSAELPQRLALADQLWSRLLVMQTAVLSARDMARRMRGDHDDDDDHDSKPWLMCRVTQSESMELNKFDLACSPEHSKSAPALPECREESSSEKEFRAHPDPSAGSVAQSLVDPPLEKNARVANTAPMQSPRPTQSQTALVERNLSASNEIELRHNEDDTLDMSAFTVEARRVSPEHQQAALDTFPQDLRQCAKELVLGMPSSSLVWGLAWIPGALVIRPLLGALEAPATSGSAVAATLEILCRLLQQGAARGLILDEQRDLAVLPVADTSTDRASSIPSTVFMDQLVLLGRRWLDAYARSQVLPHVVATLTHWYQQRSTAATHEGALVNFLRLLETIVEVSLVPPGASAIDAQQTSMHSKSEDVDGDQVIDSLPFAALQSILMLCLHIAIGRARHRSFLLRRRGEDALVTLTRRLFQWHFSPGIREWVLRLIAAMIDPCIADVRAVVSAGKSEPFGAAQRASSSSASEVFATSIDLELRHALWGDEVSGRPATEWISLGLLSSSSDAARRRHETQILGLRILQTVLDAARETSSPHSETVLTRIGALRPVVLGPVSVAMLRCCALSGEAHSTEVLTRALPLSLKLVECLGSHAFSFFHTLLTIVIPSHLSIRSETVHRAIGPLREELVFQVLRQLGSRLDLLWSAYLAYDCSLKFMDAVEPLFDTLAASRHPFAAQVLGTVLEMLQLPDYGPCPLMLPTEVSDWEALCLQKKRKRHRREVLRSIPFASSKERECSASELWRHLEENLPMNDAERRDAVSTLALFLRNTPELDKALIGQVIGSPDQFSQQVLASYAATFDLRNLEIDVALRLFLESFRLPGESQKIDRIMQAFANHYFVQNRGAGLPLASADATHVLSFAIIMLNTDQHHDQVKHRMTVTDFIRNNRGLNDGKDLPSDYLSGIYERIQQSEIRLSDDHGLIALDAVHWEAQLRTQEQLERVRPDRLELPGDRRQAAQTLLQLIWPSVLASYGSRLVALILPPVVQHLSEVDGNDSTNRDDDQFRRTAYTGSTIINNNNKSTVDDTDFLDDEDRDLLDDDDSSDGFSGGYRAAKRWLARLEHWKATIIDDQGERRCRYRTKAELVQVCIRLLCRLGWTAYVLDAQAILASVIETLSLTTGLLDDRWPVASAVQTSSVSTKPVPLMEADLTWTLIGRWERAPLTSRSCVWFGRHRGAQQVLVSLFGLASRCVSGLNQTAWFALIALHLRLVEMRLTSPLLMCGPAASSLPHICLFDGTEVLTGGLAPRWACILRDLVVEKWLADANSTTQMLPVIGYKRSWALLSYVENRKRCARDTVKHHATHSDSPRTAMQGAGNPTEHDCAAAAAKSPNDFGNTGREAWTDSPPMPNSFGTNTNPPGGRGLTPQPQSNGGGFIAALLTGIGLGFGSAQQISSDTNSWKGTDPGQMRESGGSLCRAGSLRDLERTLSDPEDDVLDLDVTNARIPATAALPADGEDLSSAEKRSTVSQRESGPRRRLAMEDSWDLVRAVLPRYLRRTDDDVEARFLARYCLLWTVADANLFEPTRWNDASTALLKALQVAAEWAFGLQASSLGERLSPQSAVNATREQGASIDVDHLEQRWFPRRALRKHALRAHDYAIWRRAWLLEHLSLVILSDPVRMQRHWRMIHDLVHMELVTLNDQPLLSLECAIFALLRLAMGFLPFAKTAAEDVSDEDNKNDTLIESVFRDLRLLIPLPSTTFSAISLPIVAGLHLVLEQHSSLIPLEDGWQTICILLEHGVRQAEPCSEASWHALTLLLKMIERHRDAEAPQFPDASFDEVLLLCLEALLTVMEQPNVNRARAAAASIHSVFRRALDRCSGLGSTAPDRWLPVVDRLARCVTSHGALSVRHEVLVVLERILMEPPWQRLSETQRKYLFSGVLLPLAESLQLALINGSIPMDDPTLLERFFIRLVMILNRNWLLHHPFWRDVGPSLLSEWWMRLLDMLCGLYALATMRYSSRGNSPPFLGRRTSEYASLLGSETLAEHISETLKNTLLVMVTNGFLLPPTETCDEQGEGSPSAPDEEVAASRWSNTFAQLAPLFPDLEEELWGLMARSHTQTTPVRNACLVTKPASDGVSEAMGSAPSSATVITLATEASPTRREGTIERISDSRE